MKSAISDNACVLKWSWPRKATTARQESQKLQAMASFSSLLLSYRLPNVRLAGVAAVPEDPVTKALREDADFGHMVRLPELLVVGRQFTVIWSLHESKVMALVADQAWLLSCLCYQHGFVHGDISVGNVACLHGPVEMQHHRRDVWSAPDKRCKVVMENQESPNIWAGCDDFPLAGILDVENGHFVDGSAPVNHRLEQQAALSATQAFWSRYD